MKLQILLTIALLTSYLNAQGQDSLKYSGQPFIIRDLPSNIDKIKPPLYIIRAGNKATQIPAAGHHSSSGQVKRILKKVNPDWIESIDIVKEKSSIEKYGPTGQYGVVIIYLKNGTHDKLPRKLKRAFRNSPNNPD